MPWSSHLLAVGLAFAAAVASAAAAPLDLFLPAIANVTVQGATLQQLPNTDLQACAARCVGQSACVSFTFTASATCTLNQYASTYTVVASGGTSYYFRIQPRDDRRVHPAVAYKVQVPTSNVQLLVGSLLRRVFDANIIYLLNHPGDDLLYFFRQRNGTAQPPGQCWGWDANLRG
jgi:hypothetical protein